MKKPTEYEFTMFLYSCGFRWHSTGTIKRDGAKFGRYLEGDFLPDSVRQAIAEKFGSWVEVFWSGSQYAPERSKRPIIVLLSAKAYKGEATAV